MSIESKLKELEIRRNAVLQEMDDNTTHLGKYLRTRYAPVNVLRRHIGPAIGIAATFGTLAAGAKIPRHGLLRMLWTRVNRGHRSASPPESSNASGSAGLAADAAHDGAPAGVDSQRPRHHALIDAAQPILTHLIVDVAQAIPWRNLMGRILEKRHKSANGSDHAGSSQE